MRKIVVGILIGALCVGGLSFVIATQPKFPVPDKIPGVTAADPAPRGCVDCHTSDKADDPLAKLSVLMDAYNKSGAPASVKAAAQAAVKAAGGDPAKITGKHPVGGAMFKGQDLPKGLLAMSRWRWQEHPAPGSYALSAQVRGFQKWDIRHPRDNGLCEEVWRWCTACHTFEGWKEKDGALTSKIVLKQGKE
jgi:hypothetical protein